MTIRTGSKSSAILDSFMEPRFPQVTTTTLLRLADAPVLPFEFGEFVSTVHRYVDQIKKILRRHTWTSRRCSRQLDKTDSDAQGVRGCAQDGVSPTPTPLGWPRPTRSCSRPSAG